jgi:hypothetical protein
MGYLGRSDSLVISDQNCVPPAAMNSHFFALS